MARRGTQEVSVDRIKRGHPLQGDHRSQCLSERAIGRALKVSRTAVAKYLEWFRASGLTWEQAKELPDSELITRVGGPSCAAHECAL